MQEKIIGLLKKKSGYVSGEEISSHLKISRQALWKHIQELKRIGYEIVAVPHLGYQLRTSPDRLFPSEITDNLKTKFLGRKIHYFDSLASTMDLAMGLGIKNEPEGALVLAETQTRGKGRLGRAWFSPKYKGIYMSLILRPVILPTQASLLTLMAAVSVCQAIEKITSLEARIKWPNDILLGSKKVGGVLTELNGEMDATFFVIIGLGLNINNNSRELVENATSLKEEKKEKIDRRELLQEILFRLEVNYLALRDKASADILDKWRHYNVTLGKRVRVICQRLHLEGEAVDIDQDGGLLVRKDSGLVEKVTAGDIVHLR